MAAHVLAAGIPNSVYLLAGTPEILQPQPVEEPGLPKSEGIARVARVVAASGSKYAALVSQFGRGNTGREEQLRIKPMIEALLHRGIDDGTFRSDITAAELGFLFGSLLEAGARMAAEHQAGAEKAAALVTSVFLRGTQRGKEDGPASPTMTPMNTGSSPQITVAKSAKTAVTPPT